VESFHNDDSDYEMDKATEKALNSLAIEDAVLDGSMEEKPAVSVGVVHSPE